MINNSTNINKMDNHLSPQTIEHKKKKTTYDVENSGPEMEQPQKCN